ncbi:MULTISPECIES: energy transducer TonB [Pseudoxanthomonas]|jgi:protein TonB|uniref:Energy transducer TonB n=1 Tax=Pseudoxanthomonas winnipegensis TaxID=2480810 RepID=A0A4Q8LXC9_9GAMM|nr:TonB family protein [Pseudoxanthomonas winnipegensis]RZZ90861.1 energy transducer TonB [Pseudoxanthomonas winnipegensis]TAA10987.1 energy transducer TonB [Pseudoxanthomonas winnipegensis]TAA18413.1 energy transducer TonB [Pseudoxanthomonas winnipegensis]TAA36028.1 energy transducer TonB [Pseudoxanthomonas winnipegensis]TAA42368.1 energy transducer TonB [Pseudoxanthomonas winnipegensis]
MSSAALPAPPLDENARLGATLALSVLIHGIVLLGLGFALDDNAPVVPTLDVILSQTSTPLTPKQADFLAAASQQGGGDAQKSRRPRESQAGVVPQAEAGVSPVPLRAQAPDAAPPPQTRVVTAADSDIIVPPQEAHPRPDRPDLPPGEQKIEHDMEMARLAAEIHLRSDLYAKRPKRKFVSASTQEYAWANYLRAWVDRAERVGNLNYPDEARRKRLSGQVVISVAVRRNGTVEQSRIIQSSGVPLLDSAALRVVALAAPFPPLPDTDEHVDILHVTRTWVFLPAGELRDQ